MHADLVITMLDGDLGAVTNPDGVVLPLANEPPCWCGCMVCLQVTEPQEPAVIG